MRPMQLLAVVLGLIPASQVVGEQFPYTATISGEEVYVRSGPGQNYYPTAKLTTGDTVEVYRHDPGGWSAIRPPQGSFSWVSGRYLQLDSDNLATVTGDNVVVRVGSQLSEVRDVIQVRLDRGEEVEVLETKQLDTTEGNQTWYKIAPVSGEFRWVLGKYLQSTSSGNQRKPPPDQTETSDEEAVGEDAEAEMADAETNAAFADRHESIESTESRVERTAAVDVTEHAANVRQTAWTSAGSRRTDNSTRATRAMPASADERPQRVPVRAKPVSTTRPKAIPPDVDPQAASSTLPQLEELDFQLSQMVVEEPTVWHFDALQMQAERLLDRAETAVERGRAKLLLGKIARFEDIRARYQAVADVRAMTDRNDRSNTEATGGEFVVKTPADSPRFDGAGRLASVVSPKLGLPPFALLDEKGAVRTYVTAVPGVNLRQHVGRRVGIHGYRGHSPELNSPHLTARRVTVLDESVLR